MFEVAKKRKEVLGDYSKLPPAPKDVRFGAGIRIYARLFARSAKSFRVYGGGGKRIYARFFARNAKMFRYTGDWNKDLRYKLFARVYGGLE